MKTKKIAIYSATLFLLIAIFTIEISPPQASGQDTLSRTVLVLHSYHRQLSWVKSIEEGIVNYFEKADPTVELRFEYMDTKRNTEPNYVHMLYDLYQYKFKSSKFDVIICSDNNALNFLLKHRNKLFSDTPVVFCGINNFKDAMIAGKKMFTGTVEGFSFKETLDMAIEMHPKTKQIVFYGDNSPTYLANKALLEQIADDYKPGLEFIFKDDIKIKQIQDHIRLLNQETLILIGSTIRGEDGSLLSFEQSVAMMEKVSQVPIYGCWDFYLDHGIVGGKLISGFSQGEIAAKIADRIINGDTADNIPVTKTSPNRFMFDYRQLKKFNIKIDDLPTDSIVINQLQSFYSENKNIVWGSIATVSALLIIILVLVLAIKNRKRAEKALQASEQKLITHLQNTPIGAISWDLNFNTTEWNPAAETIFGYSKEETLGKNVAELIIPEVMRKLVNRIFSNLIFEKGGTHSINENITKDGRRIVCDWYNTALKDSDGNIIGIASLVSDITERKQIEKETKNHAENLKAILNSTPNILVLVNDESRVEMINNSGAAFLGKEKKNLLGLLGGEVFNCLNSFDGEGCGRNPDCSQCPVRTKVTSTFQTGEPHSEEEGRMTFLINNKKISMDFLISTALLKLDKTNKILLSLTDITARKKTEKLLQNQRYFLQKAQEIGQIGTWELDIPKNKLFWTDENYRIFGIPIGTELTYDMFLNCVHPDDREYVDTAWKASFNKKPYDIEHRLLVNGKVKWVWEKAELEFAENDECIRGTGFTQDITYRKQAEESLKLSKQKLDLHFLKTPLAVIEWDLNFKVQSWNPAAEKIFGYTAKEILGRHASIIIPEKHKEHIDTVWEGLLQQKSGTRSTNENINKKGDMLFCEWFNTPIINEAGNTIAVFSLVQNITKRKQAEVEKKKLEFQIQQTQKMESIGTLAGGIAHDFNNILFPIVGHTEMLIEDVPEDSPFRTGLDQIYTGALRASELVKQILTFSRQDSSELKFMKMQPIIKETLKLIRATIPTTIEINQDLNPNCGIIKADPTQIHQIVMNLTTNAYHAMEETGGELKVNLKKIELGKYDIITPEMTPGVYACLSVSDTGIGMNKNLTKKIFDPFFTTKEKGKGTGMGLSVVHGIVKNMDGAIKVYSEPDKGTEFNIYLPLVKNFSEKKLIHQTKEPIQGGIERILLVDDEDAIITMEKLMLERLGYHVTARTSSIEALEAFRDSPEKFDLVITDMAMPTISGDKLAVELTKIRADIPILLCTGFSEILSEEEAASLGIKGFLLKPIVMKDLSQKIREVLDNKRTEIMGK